MVLVAYDPKDKYHLHMKEVEQKQYSSLFLVLLF